MHSPPGSLLEVNDGVAKWKLRPKNFFYFIIILFIFWHFFVFFYFAYPGLYKQSQIAYSITISVLLFSSLFYSIMVKIGNSTSLLQFQSYPIEQLRFCQRCNSRVPFTAYHCNECKKCRIFYDHHDLLLGTCISKANYQYYIKYILSLLFANLLICCSCFNVIFNFTRDHNYILRVYQEKRSFSLNEATFYVLLFFCIGLFMLPFFGFYLLQLVRILINQRYETTSHFIRAYKKPIFYSYEMSNCCNCCSCC